MLAGEELPAKFVAHPINFVHKQIWRVEKNETDDEHLPMARLLAANTVLRGHLSSYTIGKELHRAADDGAVYLARSAQSPSITAVRPT